jgi:hypothetical protein
MNAMIGATRPAGTEITSYNHLCEGSLPFSEEGGENGQGSSTGNLTGMKKKKRRAAKLSFAALVPTTEQMGNAYWWNLAVISKGAIQSALPPFAPLRASR